MTIINPLPYTIANGDPVDATPVQANLNQIVSNVNANAAAVAGNASQEFLVATTTNPAGAVPLAQAQSQFSALNGSTTQPFSGATFYSSGGVNASGTLSGANVYSSGSIVSATPAASGSTQVPQISQILGAGGSTVSNVTASRALGTTYTNGTGRVLKVYVTASAAYANTGEFLLVGSIGGNGVDLSFGYNSSGGQIEMYGAVQMDVPPGATYEANYNVQIGATSTSMTWYEY